MTGNRERDRGRWIRQVVQQYEGGLLRYAAQITGDLERGRDVVQDTFLRLCREDPARLDGHLAEWLFTVCRNRALDVRRKESRMTTVSGKQVDAHQGRPPQGPATIEQRESIQQILTLLSQLPQNQQEVVRLKFQNGLSYREISRITELSVSNVGYLLHTALQRIRRELNAESS